MIFEQHVKRSALAMSAVAGGLCIAMMSQLASAPKAHADDPITEMFDNVQATITFGDGLLNLGADSFAAGDIPEALNVGLAGVEDLLFGPEENVFIDSVGILTGTPVDYEIDISSIQLPPTDLTDAVAEVQNIIVTAQGEFTDAAQSLALGDYGFAAFDDLVAANLLVFDAPNELIIGAAESILGI